MFLFFFIMSKILEILAVVAFNCNIDGNLAFEWEKWKKRFQYYVAAAGMSDNKEKRAVLLNLIGPARQEIFNTLSLSLLSFSLSLSLSLSLKLFQTTVRTMELLDHQIKN